MNRMLFDSIGVPVRRSSPKDPTVGSYVPCQDGTLWAPTRSEIAGWQDAFPDLDVMIQIKRAFLWIRANPRRRKTARGMCKYILNWLNKADLQISQVQKSKKFHGDKNQVDIHSPAQKLEKVDHLLIEAQEEAERRYKMESRSFLSSLPAAKSIEQKVERQVKISKHREIFLKETVETVYNQLRFERGV